MEDTYKKERKAFKIYSFLIIYSSFSLLFVFSFLKIPYSTYRRTIFKVTFFLDHILLCLH